MFQVVIQGASNDQQIISEPEEILSLETDSLALPVVEHCLTEVTIPSSENICKTNLCDPHGNKKPNMYKKKFHSSWCEDPLLKDWLEEKDGQGYCKFCLALLAPGKSELLRHGATKKHNKLMNSSQESLVKSRQKDNDETVTIDLRGEMYSTVPLELQSVVKTCQPSGDIEKDDHTRELEEQMASLFGKESGLWTPASVVANYLCMEALAEGYTQLFCGHKTQMYTRQIEIMSKSRLVRLYPLMNNSDGTFCMKRLQRCLKPSADGYPDKNIVCFEQTHLHEGGKVIPMQWVNELHALCSKENVHIHMDGVDVFSASAVLGVGFVELAKTSTTVTVHTPDIDGAVLVGPKSIIDKARNWRNNQFRVGNSGIITATALSSLKNAFINAKICRLLAQEFGAGIASVGSQIVQVDENLIQTNIVHLNVDTDLISLWDFSNRLMEVTDGELKNIGKVIKLQVEVLRLSNQIRFAFRRDAEVYISHIIRKVVYVINEFEQGSMRYKTL